MNGSKDLISRDALASTDLDDEPSDVPNFSALDLQGPRKDSNQINSLSHRSQVKCFNSQEIPMEVFELMFKDLTIDEMIDLKLVSRKFLEAVHFVSFFCHLVYTFNETQTSSMANLLKLVKFRSRKKLKSIEITMLDADDEAISAFVEAFDNEDLQALESLKFQGRFNTESKLESAHQDLMTMLPKCQNLHTFHLEVTANSNGVERLFSFKPPLSPRSHLRNLALHIPFSKNSIDMETLSSLALACSSVTKLKLSTVRRPAKTSFMSNNLQVEVLGGTLLEQSDASEVIDFRNIDISRNDIAQHGSLDLQNLRALRLTCYTRFRSRVKLVCPSLKALSTSFGTVSATEIPSLFVDLNSSGKLEVLELECHQQLTHGKLIELLRNRLNLKTLIIKAGSCLSSIPSKPLSAHESDNTAAESHWLCPKLEKLYLHRLEGEELLELIRARREIPDAICKSLKVIGGSAKTASDPKFEELGVAVVSLPELSREVSAYFE